MATVNLLLDCSCSASFAAADLGGGESYTITPTSFKADSVSISEDISSAPHQTGQDGVAMHRKGVVDWEITVKTKLYNAALLAAVRANDLCQITITAPTGFTVVGKGLTVKHAPTYESPSEVTFSIKAHGIALTYT